MLKGIAAGLAAGALWALVFLAPSMVYGMSAVDLTAGRFLSYGALSLCLMLVMRKSVWPNARQALAAAGMSVLGYSGYYLLLVLAIRDAGTVVPSLVIGTIPIWMLLLGRPTHLRIGALLPGLLLTAMGLGLMVFSSLGSANAADILGVPNFWRGAVFSVASMALWTAFGLLNAAWLKLHPEVSAMTWANWLGIATGLGALLLWMAAGSDVKVLLAQPERAWTVTLLIATGLGSGWLATLLWNVASQRLSASLCGQLIVSETIFALLYSFVYSGQWPATTQLVAAVFFVAGILASTRAHHQLD